VVAICGVTGFSEKEEVTNAMAVFGGFWVPFLKKKKARHETRISRIHTKEGKK
jgi:hypothetical protein